MLETITDIVALKEMRRRYNVETDKLITFQNSRQGDILFGLSFGKGFFVSTVEVDLIID